MLVVSHRTDATSIDSLRLEEQLSLTGSGSAQYTGLDISSNGLVSLVFASGAHHLAPFLSCLRVLRAPHNRLSSLNGIGQFPLLEVIDVSHNCIRVVDNQSLALLGGLPHLRELDMSHNELRVADFASKTKRDGSCGAPTMGAAMPPSNGDFPSLALLNLSHNRLLDFPDLSGLGRLSQVDLSHNQLEDMQDVAHRISSSVLFALRLEGNAITAWWDLLPFAETLQPLKALSVAGNPFSISTPFSWRAFLFGILPQLAAIDGLGPSTEELAAAERVTAIDLRSAFSLRAKDDIELELRRVCVVPDAPREQVTAKTAPPGGLDTNHALDPRTTLPRHGGSAVELVATPSTEAVLSAIQKKLRTVNDVVLQLWRESLSRRTFAAITIQRYFRTRLTWKFLPPVTRRRLLGLQRRMKERRAQMPVATPHSYKGSNAPRTLDPAVRVQVEAMETLMRQLWNDVQPLKRELYRTRQRAALTIQRYFRGFLARCQWGGLRTEYLAFLESLRPAALILQRVGVGYRARKRLGTRSRAGRSPTCKSTCEACDVAQREIANLKKELSDLRLTVHTLQEEVQHMARRQRLERYDDPEAAMRRIIERRTGAAERAP